MKPGTTLGIVLAVASGFLAVIVGIVGIAMQHGEPAATDKAAPVSSSKDGPYPECAVIVAWLRKNAADPDSIQIISWESRTVATKESSSTYFGHVTVYFKHRGKNARGGASVWLNGVNVKDGQVIDPFYKIEVN